eukprot:4031190-Pyramimonas_sp.AAC.1
MPSIEYSPMCPASPPTPIGGASAPRGPPSIHSSPRPPPSPEPSGEATGEPPEPQGQLPDPPEAGGGGDGARRPSSCPSSPPLEDPERAEAEAPEVDLLPWDVPDPGSFHWGVFRFSPKKKDGVAFAWEALCPFHRRSRVTGCTRTLRVDAAL